MSSNSNSDSQLMDFLRRCDSGTVSDMADELGVTGTAIRQRLGRLMGEGLLERQTTPGGRGRPSHQYRLTPRGRRQSGANFVDLAMALWQEVRSIDNAEIRNGLLKRIASRLADFYRSSLRGESLEQKMESLADLFTDRQIPVEVNVAESGPELTVLACPYPDLAEQDRGICAMERMMFSELLGANTRLSQCRLDGEDCCTFQPQQLAMPQ